MSSVTTFVLAYLLFLSSALAAVFCVMQFRNIGSLAKKLFPREKAGTLLAQGLFVLFMAAFIAGCITVFFFLVNGVPGVSVLSIAIVAIAGALFVLLWIALQLHLLTSMKERHEGLAQANNRLLHTENVTIFMLAHQAELRGFKTEKHLERTGSYVRLLAAGLSEIPKYRSYLVPGYIADIEKSALLHDIGMVVVPDPVLKKPARLTPEEYEIVKKHCEHGAGILRSADAKMDFQSYLKLAIHMVLSHHERWDGKGYPRGIEEETIPLSGRIMALADVYDALRSDYPYRPRLTHEEACRTITQERGRHFDPEIVDVFFNLEKKFQEISFSLPA